MSSKLEDTGMEQLKGYKVTTLHGYNVTWLQRYTVESFEESKRCSGRELNREP